MSYSSLAIRAGGCWSLAILHYTMQPRIVGTGPGEADMKLDDLLDRHVEYRRLGLSGACANWDNSKNICAT